MIKKSLIYILCFTLLLALVSCKSGDEATTQSSDVGNEFSNSQKENIVSKVDTESVENETATSATNTIEEDLEDFAAIGDVEVEELGDLVTITLPVEFVGETITQADLDVAKGEDYVDATLNSDGSVTYVLTKEQHDYMIQDVRAEIQKGLDNLIADENLAVDDIKVNDDLSIYDVSLSTEEIGMTESFSVMGLFMYSGMYHIMNNSQVDDVSVNFYNPAGEIIDTFNLTDAIEQP